MCSTVQLHDVSGSASSPMTDYTHTRTMLPELSGHYEATRIKEPTLCSNEIALKTLHLHFGNVSLVFILFPSAHGFGILKSNLTLSQSLLTEFSNFSQIFPLPPGGQVHLSCVQQLLHLHLQVRGQLLLDLVGQLLFQGLFVPALLLQKSDVVPDEEVVVGSHLGSVNVGGLMRPVDVAVANLLQTLINLDNIIIVFDIIINIFFTFSMYAIRSFRSPGYILPARCVSILRVRMST